jgi:hypothetical protein
VQFARGSAFAAIGESSRAALRLGARDDVVVSYTVLASCERERNVPSSLGGATIAPES